MTNIKNKLHEIAYKTRASLEDLADEYLDNNYEQQCKYINVLWSNLYQIGFDTALKQISARIN